MSLDSMRKYVEDRLATYMAANHPTWDVRFANTKASNDDVVPFVLATLLEGESRQLEIRPDSPSRHVGVMQIDVLVPENEGTSDLNTVTEALGKLFMRNDTYLDDNARLVTRDPAYRYHGVGSGYARQIVSIPYWRDEKV